MQAIKHYNIFLHFVYSRWILHAKPIKISIIKRIIGFHIIFQECNEFREQR